MDVVVVIAQLVQVILGLIPKDSPCPLCAARQADPLGTDAVIAAANVAADAAEKAKFG